MTTDKLIAGLCMYKHNSEYFYLVIKKLPNNQFQQ
jgi:hypothetical protein